MISDQKCTLVWMRNLKFKPQKVSTTVYISCWPHIKTCFYADFVCSFVSLRKISMTPNRHPHAQLTTKNKSSSFHKSQTDKTFSNHVPTHVLEIFLQCLWCRECSYFWWNEAFQYTALWLEFLIFVQKLWGKSEKTLFKLKTVNHMLISFFIF